MKILQSHRPAKSEPLEVRQIGSLRLTRLPGTQVHMKAQNSAFQAGHAARTGESLPNMS